MASFFLEGNTFLYQLAETLQHLWEKMVKHKFSNHNN